MPPSRRDKTTGLPVPNPVVPATSICFTLQVPNAIEYRSALKGALSSLGQAWTWAQTAGQDNDASYQAAELWRQRLNDAFYDLECSGVPMSCNDVADCIETSPAVRAALDSFIPAVPIDGMIYPPGVPLTPGQMTSRLNPIDACAFDPYWAQVEQYVDYMVDLGQDVLDQIALYNSALDLGENVPMGKFLGKIKNTSGGGKVLEFLQWVLTTVKAAYEAADNTANRDAIKCDIFCQFRDDCLITIQGTLDVLNERLGGLLSPGDLDDLDAMINAFLTVTFNPALALDLWVLFLMGAAKTAGMFGLQGIDETLQLVLEVAVNDANNDWETKCDQCDQPDPCTDIDWVLYYVLTEDPEIVPSYERDGCRYTFYTHPGTTRIFFRLPNGRTGNFTNLDFHGTPPANAWSYAPGTTSTGGGINYSIGLADFENPGSNIMGYGLNGIFQFSFDFEEIV